MRDFVDQKVVSMRNQLTRTGDPAGTAEIGMVGQPGCRIAESSSIRDAVIGLSAAMYS